MRRVLLGGLGIALGVLARPAAAQEYPGRPTTPATRAARLGAPVAVPETPPASSVAPSGVTPVGLFTRGQPVAAGAQPIPVGTQPLPLGTQYGGQTIPAGVPLVVGGLPVRTDAAPTPLPAPRPMGGPTLTEIHGAPVGGPTNPGGVVVIPPAGVAAAAPSVPLPGTTVVPSVGPVDCPPGIDCPAPTPDAPLYGGGSGAVRFPGLNRLFGLGSPCGDRHWLSAEYLAWWTRSTSLPPLASTGVLDPTGAGGILGQQPVLDGSFGNTFHSGARFGGGWWFSDEQRRGIDARFFFLFSNSSSFAANSGQYPVLFAPFFNLNNPVGPTGNVVSAPGVAAGGIAATLENSLWGAEVNYRRFLAGTPCYRLDGLVGFRYLNFKETLTLTETAALVPGSPLTGMVPPAGVISDRFRTENNFYGGQVGLTGELRRGRWFVDTRATVALGSVNQMAEINGGQARALAGGGVAVFPGGLYAQPGANIGTFTQNKFAVMPEIGINLGYHITPHCRVFVGYNFLYLSSVLRPANVIDQNIDAARIPNFPVPGNPGVLPGTPHPSPLLRTTDFWAQGINFGVQWTW